MQKLNAHQVWKIREYFFALTRLSGTKLDGINEIPDKMLEGFTELYCHILTEGGGRPVLAAEKTLKTMTLSGRFGRAARAYPKYWLERERYYPNHVTVATDGLLLFQQLQGYLAMYRS